MISNNKNAQPLINRTLSGTQCQTLAKIDRHVAHIDNKLEEYTRALTENDGDDCWKLLKTGEDYFIGKVIRQSANGCKA